MHKILRTFKIFFRYFDSHFDKNILKNILNDLMQMFQSQISVNKKTFR